jgi:hypothetical protein
MDDYLGIREGSLSLRMKMQILCGVFFNDLKVSVHTRGNRL